MCGMHFVVPEVVLGQAQLTSTQGSLLTKFLQELKGSMNDLNIVKVIEGGIGLLHPNQDGVLYESMHLPIMVLLEQKWMSFTKEFYTTTIFFIDMFVHFKFSFPMQCQQTLKFLVEEYGGQVELAYAYYKWLDYSILKNFDGT